ncbi:phenylacetate--CoA ligase family protein [Marinobacterium jannaschii]|uniref:hypothetical protein n=1 Tax=Marinobacterium jannaschii TaxID=64970 RepID=UPI0004852DE9|nr:hypothetical protein [Marinobacterium jannaschii]
MKQSVKRFFQKTPVFLGKHLSALPFEYRLGQSYVVYKEKSKLVVRPEEIFYQVKNLVSICEKRVPFYKKFYKEHDFSSLELNSFDDLSSIPIIKKKDLQKVKFEDRIVSLKGGVVTNTGGTSGQPLKLLLDGQAYSREWSHMHAIWEQLGYKTKCMKLTFRGMNLGEAPVVYNFIHNEFQVNAYCDFELLVDALYKVLSKYKIEYLHGYPSGIYEFLKHSAELYPELIDKIRLNVKGVFLGSEYPAPVYRDYIESILCIPTLSWYGHSEMAILAREYKEPFVYFPFQSYGFSESVSIEGRNHLVGTTVHNQLGPLIRYDTGDLIDSVSYKNGLLESFKISEGRTGEFVSDLNGRNISLTALVFGRHHRIFEYAEFVQVKQAEAGRLTVYVTSQSSDLNCELLFDTSGLNMDVDFKLISSPIKTQGGKVSLIVKE